MDPLSFDVQRQADRAEVRVSGTLDMNGILRLEPVLNEVIAAGDLRHLTLDLSGLASIDSMAMTLLIETYASAQRNDLELRLRRLRNDARPALEIVGPDLETG
jgi:anti-anti-sigma factor